MNIYQERTLWLISIFLILRLIFLYLSPLGLHGDEAQYWVWSKNLDWGYYSKPPFVALIISITTSIFGDIEWAVRVSSPLLHSFIAFLIFRTASFAFDERTGFWAAAIYFLMPAVWVSSAIVSTDAALLLFWALALNAWIHLRLEKSYFWTLVMAFAIGLGLLSKYAMFYFVLALLLATIFDKNSKQVFFSLKGLVLALISSCIILPNLIWNYKNHKFIKEYNNDLYGLMNLFRLRIKMIFEFAHQKLLFYFRFMKIGVSNLTHHPKNKEIYNPSSIEELMESINELGLLQPLVIDQNNQIISGNRRFESIKRLGWIDVEVELRVVNDGEEELLLVHYNKQRVKSFREILNEYLVLKKYYEVGQGKRTDLTSVRSNKSLNGRDNVSEQIGISSSQLGKLLFIYKHQPYHIDLLDKGILTVNQSYLQISREVKELRSRNENQNIISNSISNSWRFYHKSSDNMSELKDEEIQTIFTSPPY